MLLVALEYYTARSNFKVQGCHSVTLQLFYMMFGIILISCLLYDLISVLVVHLIKVFLLNNRPWYEVLLDLPDTDVAILFLKSYVDEVGACWVERNKEQLITQTKRWIKWINTSIHAEVPEMQPLGPKSDYVS